MLVIESYWIEYYKNLNLVFPGDPSNAVIWMIWGFFFATIIFVLSKKFNSIHTILISWVAVFLMLWIVLINIEMLPLKILWYNIPLSLLEVYIAVLICKKVS